ncbi:DUF6417 family protein [Streptomyces puniciscabiei]
MRVGPSCGRRGSLPPATTCWSAPTPALPRSATGQSCRGRDAGRAVSVGDGCAARLRADWSTAAGTAGRGPGGTGAHSVFRPTGQPLVVALGAEQIESVAYAFYLRSVAGCVAEANRFAHEYGVDLAGQPARAAAHLDAQADSEPVTFAPDGSA